MLSNPVPNPGKTAMRHLTLLFVCLAGLAPSARAADCSNLQTQMELTQCAGENQRIADGQLNAAYKQIQQRLKDDPDTAKLMTTAQRAWVAYRDAECTFSSSQTKGGSIYPMIYAECVTAMTQSRLKDFKQYLSCKEGDMSCPVPPG